MLLCISSILVLPETAVPHFCSQVCSIPCNIIAVPHFRSQTSYSPLRQPACTFKPCLSCESRPSYPAVLHADDQEQEIACLVSVTATYILSIYLDLFGFI
jgi:hypothetical protein